MMRVIIRAYDVNGYQRDILVQDEQQVRVHDARLKGGDHGTVIDPILLPEMVRFEVIVESYKR